MARTSSIQLGIVLGAMLSGPQVVLAQGKVFPAVFVSAGTAIRSEPEYRSPATPTVGGGVALHLNRRVATQLEFNQMLGLSLKTISGTSTRIDCSSGPCIAGPAARYSGRDGTSSLWAVTGHVVFYLTNSTIQPFLKAGLGAIRQEGVWFWSGDAASPPQEQEFRNTSLTIPVGVGVQVPLPAGLFVTPEVRFQTASFTMDHSRTFTGERSGQWTFHRSVTGAFIGAGYRW